MSAAGDNVAFRLTPPGAAAIAVVRLCGPLNDAFAAHHLSRPPKTGRCVHADLTDGDETLDDLVVVRTPAGRFDLNLHGGPWVVEAALRLAERFGYRLAMWTDEAAAFDTADDIERQMLRDLPSAKSMAVLKLLAAQPAAWRRMLDTNDRDAIRRAVEDRTLEIALAVPRVAIVGPPNVGKSTLANALFAAEHSITADRPGTTRDWVGELADLGGLVVQLIDTPGERQTSDPIEAAAIHRAKGVVDGADVVIVAVDRGRPLDAEARTMLGRYGDAVVVRTKADRPAAESSLPTAIDVCALDGRGLAELMAAVRAKLGVTDLLSPSARCWTDAQRERLRRLAASI